MPILLTAVMKAMSSRLQKRQMASTIIVYKNPSILGPSMEFDLTEEQLQEKLKSATNVKQATPTTTNTEAGERAPISRTTTTTTTNLNDLTTNLNTAPEHGYRLISDPNQKIKEDFYNALGEDQKPFWEPYAVGATFKKGGLFAGRVHDTEEITPQAITKRGPGPIAKAIDLLNNVTSGKKRDAPQRMTFLELRSMSTCPPRTSRV